MCSNFTLHYIRANCGFHERAILSRFDISTSGSVCPKHIGYFNLDWSNRHVVCTFANGYCRFMKFQWHNSVGSVSPDSGRVKASPLSRCTRHVDCRIGLC